MVDWLTYKGQNPWTCVALHDKVEYNEGSYIAKSPKVSGGTPTWEIGKTGPAITDTHVPCGYWFKPIPLKCNCRDTIVYTSLQMSINQQQTLSASGIQSDECYSWAITRGGGSLSALTGKSVVYTAPATNVNCNQNPTIALSCGGSVVDTVTIAVNQVTSSYAAYEFNGECEQGCRQYWVGYWDCQYYYRYLKTKYTCNGSIYSGPTVTPIVTSALGCEYTNYPACTKLKAYCDNASHCIAAGGCCNTYTHGFVDLRTSAQKAAGCCPAGLL